jgi:2-dehydropantoate 2-reductase
VSHEADLERRGDLLHNRPDVDGPNSLGQSIARRTVGTEVDFRAGEIVLLGRLHGVPTPVNARIQDEVHRQERRRLSRGGGANDTDPSESF